MIIRPRSDSSGGIALIIVMIVIVVLAILAGGFAYSMKTEMRLARLASYESDFEWLGRSGVELARCVLAKQFETASEPYDSLKQQWAGGPGNTNASLTEACGCENGLTIDLGSNRTATVTIVDHERKFNINIAGPVVLNRALMFMGVDAGVSPMISDSILDWIDKDNDEHLSGAESDFYRRLDPPYLAKNGWIDDLSELLLVRGVTPEIYWGTASNHAVAAFQMRDPFERGRREQVSYPFGLHDLFTPLSNGKINVNTAPPHVLQLVPGFDSNLVQQVVQCRAGPDGQDGTEDDIPFTQVGELINCGVPNLLAQELSFYCGVRSSVFEVRVDCEIGGFRREYIAIIYRMNQRDLKVLTMYWKPPEGKKPDPNEWLSGG